MLPNADRGSPEPPTYKKSKTTPEYSKYPLAGVAAYAALPAQYPRTWLLLSILFLQILLVFTARSFPFSSLIYHRHLSTTPYAAVSIHSLPSPSAATVSPNLTTISAQNPADSLDLTITSSSDAVIDTTDHQCPYGKVFVYDLPPELNSDLIRNCHGLSPWGSRCAALSNAGFGLPAPGMSGIVPEILAPAWHATDQFVAEILYHNRILHHKCRTTEPESATAFYIPFYAGLAVGKYLWSRYSPKDRDRHCELMLQWVRDQPYWRKSNGWDHFITLARISWDFRRSKDADWGSSFIYMPSMRNVTRLLIERNPWDYFDIGVPYPTGFHPRTADDVRLWQDHVRTRRRRTLFSFAGAKRDSVKNDFRGLLLNHCREESDACRAVDCSGGTRCANGTAGAAILETFLDSDFCLQPRGDSFTRRSIFDCMVAGSIPVFFWRRSAYYQYQWFLPEERQSYSVFIDRNAVKNGTSIRGVLEKYGKEDVRRMREKVIEYIPKFVYAKPQEGLGGVKDAFDVALEGVLKRVKEQENWDYKWR